MAKLQFLWTEEAPKEDAEVIAFLARQGIVYERWALPEEALHIAALDKPSDEDKARLLVLFQEQLKEKRESHAYQAADVVAIRKDSPNIHEALGNFDRLHYHDDDEVRAIIGGTAIFGFLTPEERPFTVTLEAGEYVSLPAGTWHWFYCAEDINTTAIRLFKENPKWEAHYRQPKAIEPT